MTQRNVQQGLRPALKPGRSKPCPLNNKKILEKTQAEVSLGSVCLHFDAEFRPVPRIARGETAVHILLDNDFGHIETDAGALVR